MNRLNSLEKEVLVEFIREHFQVLFGIGAAKGNQQRIGLWRDITDRLNNINPETPARSVEQWKKTWRDLRKNTKLKLGKLRESQNQTGGGEVPDHLLLNSMDEAILEICGLNNMDGIPQVEEPGGEVYVEPTPPSPEFSPIISLPLDSSMGTFDSMVISVPSPQEMSVPVTARTRPEASSPSDLPTVQPQSARESTSRGALRVRRQRRRINEILPPRSQRYRDNDPRSESFSVASVTRQLNLQEETVALLREFRDDQRRSLRVEEESLSAIQQLQLTMNTILEVLRSNQNR